MVILLDKFNERLQFLRKRKMKSNPQWTQEFVAEKLGVARSTYTAYERGTKQPPMETINNIADLFETTSDFLLGRSEYQHVKPLDKLSKHDITYDSLAEINKLINQYGIEDMGFFDIEKWKNLSPYDVQLIEEHFKTVVKLAKQRNEEKE